MSEIQLPYLKNVLIKGMLTFLKGVKIGKDNININQVFELIKIDNEHLEKYRNYFEFTTELPLTYLYLIAQRAQVSLMLSKQFTIAIPGLIHVSNKLERVSKIDLNLPIQLKSNVFVEAKSEGSLQPIFNIEFYQNEKLFATCKSLYIAKRKSNSSKKNKTDKVEKFEDFKKKEKWILNKKDALDYANLSGDKNPIHTSRIIAKMFGLNSTIIHGWYLVSKASSTVEKNNFNTVESIISEFKKPIFLPSESLLKIGEKKAILENKKGELSLTLLFNS